MIQINSLFIKAFTPKEQLIMLQLLLHADENGVTEFSDRGIAKATEIPYQQVRTIHQRWLSDGTLSNAVTNAATNANHVFVTICDYESYNIFNNISNAVSNAVVNALGSSLKDKETINEKDKVSPIIPLQTEKENKKEKDSQTPIEQSLFPEQVKAEPTEKMKIATFNYSEFRDFFNNAMKEHGSRISAVRKIDERRKNVLHARMMDYGIDSLYEVVEKVVNSKFLNGGSKTGWRADFDWIFGPDNFRKIIEGKYDDREDTPVLPEEQTSDINWQS